MRGDRGRPGVGPQEAPRVRVRGRPGRRRARSDRARTRAWGGSCTRPARVDPDTGVVYLTEDEGPDGFYRFVPDTPGDLRKGDAADAAGQGAAQATTRSSARPSARCSTCNWVTIDDPNPAERRGRRLGRVQAGPRARAPRSSSAARAARTATGRSCSAPATAATPGSARSGPTRRRTTPASSNEKGKLELLFESPAKGQLDGPDNMTTSPGGAIVIAEDGNLKSNFVRGPAARRHDDRTWPRTWSPCSSTTSMLRASSTTRPCPTTAPRPATASDSPSSPARASAPTAVALRQHPGARHHVRDHGRLGEHRPVADGAGSDETPSVCRNRRDPAGAADPRHPRAPGRGALPRDWPSDVGPFVICRKSGYEIEDVDGNVYLDCISAMASVPAGCRSRRHHRRGGRRAPPVRQRGHALLLA